MKLLLPVSNRESPKIKMAENFGSVAPSEALVVVGQSSTRRMKKRASDIGGSVSVV